MLTPIDITNRVFKGGIGYDKKDVETFMLELSTDYKELYSSNVELKDKVATLNESLQHYRSIEDSMQKAMTLSEKTAEETVIAASDRARQINIEAEMKAESMLADAKAELQSTKDEIYRLQKQYEVYKQQFTKLLDMQQKLMDGEMIDIDLGADFEPSPGLFGGNSGGLGNEGGLGGGLGAGTYVGSNDGGRERTNQEPAFDRGSLNMDPFADAANGGGRFSTQTGGVYTGAKKKGAKQSTTTMNTVKTKQATPTKSAPTKATPTKAAPTQTAPKQAAPKQAAPTQTAQPNAPAQEPTQKTQTVSKEDIIAAIKAAHEAEVASKSTATPTTEQPVHTSQQPISETTTSSDEGTYSGEVENKYDESHMLDSEDNYATGGFDFVVDDSEQEEIPTVFANTTDTLSVEDDTYSGEVENKYDESRMLDSEDNYAAGGFDFVVDDSEEEEIPTIFTNTTDMNSFNSNDDVLVGDVEDNVKQSNLIGNNDDDNEGFNFL